MADPEGREPGAAPTGVTDLYGTFERLRRRHLRLSRVVRGKEAEAKLLRKQSRGRVTIATARERVGYHPAWSRWSDSYDLVASAADRLVRSRPRALSEVLLVFRALEWILLTDAVIVDSVAEHQVRIFARNLHSLARTKS